MEVVVADTNKDQTSASAGVDKSKVVHIYDGDLFEEDNELPNWWLWLFYGAIAFGLVYWLVYHDMKVADQPDEAYRKEVAALQAAEAKKLGNAAVTPESLLAMSKDASLVAAGKDVFMANCVACHKADASGLVGPNLTDAYWIHGGAPDKVYKSVHDGWVDKGMAAWAPQIGEEKVRQVVAYVITLKNTNVAGGKAPQGDKE
jgi:cytochrome c oxidase cbb3-type subunit 3